MSQVTERALFQRLKRRLEKEDNLLLKKSKPSKYANDLGSYYILDVERNLIVHKQVNIEKMAREKGILLKGETVST